MKLMHSQLVEEPETTVLLARMDEAPTAALSSLIDKTVKDLKWWGIWQNLEWFYLVGLHTQASSQLNWISSDYDLIAIDSPTWTAKEGFTGGGTSYLRNGWIESTMATKYNIIGNNAGMGFYKVAAIGAIGAAMGARSPQYNMIYSFGTTMIHYNHYTPFGVFENEAITLPCLNVGYNDNRTQAKAYKTNATAHLSNAADYPIQNPCVVEMYFMADNNNGAPHLFSPEQYGAWFAGSFMGLNLYDKFFTIIKYFYDNIGATF